MVHQDVIQLETAGHGAVNDLTDAVSRIVDDSGVAAGLVHVFNVGSTASVGMIEFEPGLQRDLPEMLDRIAPPGLQYGHEQAWGDGNAHSHLQASLMGPGITAPITEGRVRLGAWQQLVHIECDNRPRRREIIVTVFGESD